MANAFQKGLGGAATGAEIGSLVPGIGTAIGAGIGGLFGLFSGSDDVPDLPDFQYSQGSLASPDFADINIQQQNPELYKQLMQNNQLLADMQQHLAQRREGATASEQQAYNDYMAHQAEGQASSGLAGSPIGNAMMADSAARLMNAQRDRAFQEQTQLQGQVAGQMGNNFNMLSGAQNSILANQQANRQASMQRDEYMRNQQLQNYGQAQQAAAAGNQTWNGMLTGGIAALGQQNNMANWMNARGTPYDPTAGMTGIGSWFSGSTPAPMPVEANPQFAGSANYGQGQPVSTWMPQFGTYGNR